MKKRDDDDEDDEDKDEDEDEERLNFVNTSALLFYSLLT